MDSSYQAWLAYQRRNESRFRLAKVVMDESSDLLDTALHEFTSGWSAMYASGPDGNSNATSDVTVVIGTVHGSSNVSTFISEAHVDTIGPDGYLIRTIARDGIDYLVLAGGSDRGCLYAVFHVLRILQIDASVSSITIKENPHNKLRMIDHWDNMDGSIERGYAGRSIFFDQGHLVSDLTRIKDYAHLLASVGINAIAINNVNVHHRESHLITDALLPDVARLAGIFRGYGIRLFVSVNFASPMEIGELHTADPLDPAVQSWWSQVAARIYDYIHDFGGFLVKADSEFRPGPFTYGRNHADGANMLAHALRPYAGLVIWRCFVYNCTQDWRDRKTDRARAAYDHFMPLDGLFDDHVILQIKNGPMDFQVREPVSPLFGGLKDTNQILELQITQEYTGQQRHLCYLVPQWKEILDFDTYSRGEGSTISDIVSGALHHRNHGGIAAVSNVGDDTNWTGHVLAQANLFGFGRLAWDPALSAESIAREWAIMTFGPLDPVVDTIITILLGSWKTYENYTAPLGIGWMVQPGHHYGPSVDGYEYSKWGTYHFADCHGIGVDRTQKSGTGYTGHYHDPISQLYENRTTCPDDLLLFFHHVPYQHTLQSGKTVIQHIYDSHFEGVEQVERMRAQWRQIQDWMEPSIYRQVEQRLDEQVESAMEWRDVINTYFYRKSGIADAQRRMIF